MSREASDAALLERIARADDGTPAELYDRYGGDAPDDAGPLACLEPAQRVVGDDPAPQGEGEDASERDEAAGDRLRGEPLRAQAGDQAGAVVGRQLLQPARAKV